MVRSQPRSCFSETTNSINKIDVCPTQGLDLATSQLSAKSDDFARQPFAEAAERYLFDGVSRLAPRSVQTERERVKPIDQQFGSTPVWRITAQQILEYITQRKTAGRSNATINRELDVLRGVLKRARCWQHLADDVRPLPVKHNVGQALPDEQKLDLLEGFSDRPEWQSC